MKTIIAVDDHTMNLDLLEQVIHIFYPDFKFYGAKSGKEGISLAKSKQPDLILLDIMMPELDGYETCRRIKSNPQTKHIPIIMISALGHDSSERIKGLDAGADSFLSKPFDKVELKAQINVALRIKNYQEKLRNLNSELTLVEERERRRIAENLHDSLGQTLSLAYLNLTSVNTKDCDKKVKDKIDFTAHLLNKAIEESRTLTYDLSPPVLYELGFINAIEWKLEQFHKENRINTKLQLKKKIPELKKEYQIFLYRIFGELLTNINKHAKASEVDVALYCDDGVFSMTVKDNGIGIDTAQIKTSSTTNNGFGLFSITERLESINGSFNIKPCEKGTIAEIILPLAIK